MILFPPQDGNKPGKAIKGMGKGERTPATTQPQERPLGSRKSHPNHVMLHLETLLLNLRLSEEALPIHQKLSMYHLWRNNPTCCKVLSHDLT